ncbi:hypothetical protein N7G274_006915 [Stereocaulon virgatum]|uniref:Ribosomal protein S21 n=1 Tax=Stereocaulon virgatum TaxID=373712 RepID=A0ABR4A7V4_9LECA
MELRRLGDPLLRARASPLLSFLAPSVPQSWWSIAALRGVIPLPAHSPRHPRAGFHTTARRCAEKSSNAADFDGIEKPSTASQFARSRSSFSQSISSNSMIASLLENTLDSLPNPTKQKASDRPPATSFDRARRAFDNRSSRDRGARIPGSIAGKMELPRMSATSDPSQDVAAGLNRTDPQATRAKRTIRSRPTVGRTIEVNPGRSGDFGRALRGLSILCAVNRIKQDKLRQRFYERPGLKRKRLKSERWRRLFKQSFLATVSRVREMKRKGW